MPQNTQHRQKTVCHRHAQQKRFVQLYAENEAYTHYIWDVIVAAIIMDESLITDEVTLPIVICTDYGPAYGQSMAYERQAPVGAQNVRIIKMLIKSGCGN